MGSYEGLIEKVKFRTSEDLEIAKILLKFGFKPNNRHAGALFTAIRAGSLDGVKILVEAGININYSDPYNETALSTAFQIGHLEILEYLLTLPIDITRMIWGKHPKSPEVYFEATKMILDSHPKQVIVNDILMGIGSVEDLEVLDLAIQRGAYINYSDRSRGTLINRSVVKNDTLLVRKLIEHYPNIRSDNNVMLKAFEKRNIDMINLLVFITPLTPSNSAFLLTEAKFTGNLEIIKILVDAGVKIVLATADTIRLLSEYRPNYPTNEEFLKNYMPSLQVLSKRSLIRNKISILGIPDNLLYY